MAAAGKAPFASAKAPLAATPGLGKSSFSTMVGARGMKLRCATA